MRRREEVDVAQTMQMFDFVEGKEAGEREGVSETGQQRVNYFSSKGQILVTKSKIAGTMPTGRPLLETHLLQLPCPVRAWKRDARASSSHDLIMPCHSNKNQRIPWFVHCAGLSKPPVPHH